MADLYRAVRPPRPSRRREWQLYASITLVAALALAALIPIFLSIRYQLNYRRLLEDFSETTVAAFTAQDAVVELDGVTRPLSGGCCQQLYNLVAGTTPGRWRDPPEEPAPITVRYGDGAVLELWQVPLENSASSTGLYYRFTSPSGKAYGFDSALLTLRGIGELLDWDAKRQEAP